MVRTMLVMPKTSMTTTTVQARRKRNGDLVANATYFSTEQVLRKLLPGFKFTPFEKGLRQTVTWFKENYESGGVRI